MVERLSTKEKVIGSTPIMQPPLVGKNTSKKNWSGPEKYIPGLAFFATLV
jgi:hypothetical protein